MCVIYYKVKMPRKNKLTIDVAMAILKEFLDHFDNKLPAYSDQIWKEMSKRSQHLWSAHNWWINVRYNRRKIMSRARQETGLNPMDPSINTTISTEGNNEFVNLSGNDVSFNSTYKNNDSWFDLLLSLNEWEQIKPLESENKKSKHALRWVWSNIVADAFYRQYHLPCAYTFVRGECKIHPLKATIILISSGAAK